MPDRMRQDQETLVLVNAAGMELEGNLYVPSDATGIVIFAHGSGSSRLSSRNRYVASELNHAGLGTLLFDLLTPDEERIDMVTRHLRFDVPLLAERVVGAIDWTREQDAIRDLRVGLFGASTGAAAALIAAAERPDDVGAVVSRGGRPDLAERVLPRVAAPTLLIVGGEDYPVIDMNQWAFDMMTVEEKRLEIVPGATHLFEEPGKIENVAHLATEWFSRYL